MRPALLCVIAVVLVPVASPQKDKKAVEYFRLSQVTIEPQLITADGSTVTIKYEQIVPFEANKLQLVVQTVRKTVSAEEQRKYSTPTWKLSGATTLQFYVSEQAVVPAGHTPGRFKMTDGTIEFRITDTEKFAGELDISIWLQEYPASETTPMGRKVSNSVSVKGVFEK